jgi:hypothetical protein
VLLLLNPLLEEFDDVALENAEKEVAGGDESCDFGAVAFRGAAPMFPDVDGFFAVIGGGEGALAPVEGDPDDEANPTEVGPSLLRDGNTLDPIADAVTLLDDDDDDIVEVDGG